ncbi:MAG: hypothetical protein KC501_33105, partial [Myxococcales bacterium]|nr:hypothetical protein [Myxococcales bacterium]
VEGEAGEPIAETAVQTHEAEAVERARPEPPAIPPKRHGGRPYHLDLEAETSFPVEIGARISAELPHRLQLSTALGGLPGGYVDVINAVVVSAGGYDQTTAEVIRGALSSSLVWRTHFGWRPLRRYGLYFQAGYGLVALGGDATGGDVVALLTGNDALVGTGPDVVELRSTLHMIDAEIGYQLLFAKGHVSLRAALGFAGTVGAHTRAEATRGGPRIRPMLDAAADELAAYLDDTYRRYVFTPVVTVGVGYRFF